MKITNASVEINGGCNYACPVCPQAQGREKSFLKKLPLSLFENICEQLSDVGCTQLSLQGSGEPLLNRNIDEYIKIAARYKIETSIVTNGFALSESTGQKLLDAGIGDIRVSVIGYNRELYKHWMSRDAFDIVYQNCRTLLKTQLTGGYIDTHISSYHLVLDDTRVEEEIDQYLINWINPLGMKGEIWKMHNWGGQYDTPYNRDTRTKRSCGRPFSPYVNIRAGGVDGKLGAVVPCCFVLGQDSKAVLGHLEDQSLQEIWTSKAYYDLRQAHRREDFDSIEYCKGCDQLYNAPDSLVWTNIDGKQYGQHKYNQSLDFRDLI